jgi:hypothetical protein
LFGCCLFALQDYIRKKNKWLIKIHEWVQANGGDPIIPFSGAYENEVRCCMAGLILDSLANSCERHALVARLHAR